MGSETAVGNDDGERGPHQNGNKGTDNGNKGTDNGNKGTDNGNKGNDDGERGPHQNGRALSRSIRGVLSRESENSNDLSTASQSA